MTAPNGNAWRQFERDVANYLTSRLPVRVVSSRSVSGGRQDEAGDLFSYDQDDLCRHVFGWTLELKHVAGSAVPTWIRQARQSSDGSGLYAVVHKQRRKPVSEATVWLPRMVLDRWLHASHLDAEPVDEPLESLSLAAFATVIG